MSCEYSSCAGHHWRVSRALGSGSTGCIPWPSRTTTRLAHRVRHARTSPTRTPGGGVRSAHRAQKLDYVAFLTLLLADAITETDSASSTRQRSAKWGRADKDALAVQPGR